MAKPFRLYICSDIHASERTWRKLLNATRANVYKADAVLVAGDLTGKALIAVVRGEDGGESWTATVLGQRRVARSEEELKELERSIADLGYYAVRVTPEERAALEADPTVVRERFHERIAERLRSWLDLAAERLGDGGIPVYVMPGNDDDFEIDPILAESTYCRNVNEQVVELTPWHQLVSMGWSSPTPWSTPRELPEEEFLDRLSGLLKGVRDPRRTVIMTHVPPYDSGLDTAPLLSPDQRPTVTAGDLLRGPVGSTGVRRAIETFKPALGVHGHIHESGGERRIGDTVCVNAGSESSMGVLRGYLIDIGSNGVERTLRVEG
ncbi:MAG TPA: metallophosphoesterase [Candidatus Dormibacteraeota bacterium]|nr:metallophosphoesterase [Candidatus Dormibacteraeota bacterium]